MKQYLLLNISEKTTRYFLSDSLSNLRAHLRQVQWIESDCIICFLTDGCFRPILQVHSTYLDCISAHATIYNYMCQYRKAFYSLPKNFPLSIRLYDYKI